MGRLFMARLRNRLLRMRMTGTTLPPFAATNLNALTSLNGSGPARGGAYTVVDIETTGLDLMLSSIVSIGAFKMTDGRIHLGRMFDQLVNPGRDRNTTAVTIHGIVPARLASAPSAAEALDRFLDYLGDDILVAHNARFDLHFLNHLMQRRYGFPLQNLTVDTLRLCEAVLLPKLCPPLPRAPKLLGRGALRPRRFGLDEIANHLGIRIYRRHSAVGDALATAMILQHGIASLEKAGRGRLRDLIRTAAP